MVATMIAPVWLIGLLLFAAAVILVIIKNKD